MGVLPDAGGPATKRGKKLRKSLTGARKITRDGTQDEYQDFVLGFFAKLRRVWEQVAVEALGGVLKPGSYEVHTRLLGEACITPKLIELVNEGMTLRSFENHYQGEQAIVTPTVVDLEAALGKLDEAVALLSESR